MPFPSPAQDQSAPLKVTPKKAKIKPVEALALALLPWLVFTIILYIFALAEDAELLTWLFVFISALLSLLFVGVGVFVSSAVPMSLGMLCLSAIAISVPVGNMVKSNYMDEYWKLAGGAEYWNVDPAEKSSTRADGSVFDFMEGSYVDVDKSVGFMQNGHLHCVAPIVGTTKTNTPSFWAAGQNCCEKRGSFSCGDIRTNNAHSAVKLLNRGDVYTRSVKMATSVYDLQPSGSPPLLVVWTADADDYRDGLWWSGATMVISASVVHLVSSFAAGIFLSKTLPGRPAANTQ